MSELPSVNFAELVDEARIAFTCALDLAKSIPFATVNARVVDANAAVCVCIIGMPRSLVTEDFMKRMGDALASLLPNVERIVEIEGPALRQAPVSP